MRILAALAAALALSACSVNIEEFARDSGGVVGDVGLNAADTGLASSPDSGDTSQPADAASGADARASLPDAGPVPDGGPFPPGVKCPYTFTRGSGAPGSSWERTGPPGGNVSSLLALGGGVVLAGTSSSGGSGLASSAAGIYRSTDSGKTFSRVSTFSGTSVSSLVAVAGTQSVWAAVGSSSGATDDGVYLSTDGGATFAKTSQGLHNGARVRTLAVAPGSPERVWVVVEGTPTSPLSAQTSLYRSDGGGDWTLQAMGGVDAAGGPAMGLAADPVDRTRVYMSSNKSFWASSDGGANFTGTDYPRPYWVHHLFADPADAKHLIVATYDEGLLVTKDGGASFTPVALAFGVLDVVFHGTTVLAATDGGGLMVSTGGAFAPTGRCLVDPVIQSAAVAPDDASLVLAGSSGGGVFRSTDLATSFSPASGIDELLARVAVTGPTASPTVWLMSGAGLFRSTDLGNNWERVAEDAGELCVAAVAQSATAGTPLLLATNEDLFAGGGPGVGVMRLSQGDSLSLAAGLTGRNASGVAFDATRAHHALAYQCHGAAEDDAVPTGVFHSADDGATFTASSLSAGVCGYDVAPLAVAPDGSVYAGVLPGTPGIPGPSNRELWRSDDGGQSFAHAWTGSDGFEARGIFVDQGGAVVLIGRFGGGDGLRRSTDQGATFSPFASNLGNPIVNALAFAGASGILVGTEGGVFYAADGATFTDLSAGLSSKSAQGLGAAKSVAFAAMSDGIFRRTLP